MAHKLKHTGIIWHFAADNPPPKSGHYLVHTSGGATTTIVYSKFHNMWNVLDDDSDLRTGFPWNDSYIVAWADPILLRASLKNWRDENGKKY